MLRVKERIRDQVRQVNACHSLQLGPRVCGITRSVRLPTHPACLCPRCQLLRAHRELEGPGPIAIQDYAPLHLDHHECGATRAPHAAFYRSQLLNHLAHSKTDLLH